MSAVIFLGAGSSLDAGYPLTRNLLKVIEKESKNADLTTKDAWERFDKFRKNQTGFLKTILESSNPELVLTIPDLLVATLSEADQDAFRKLEEKSERGELSDSEITAGLNFPFRKKLLDGRYAKWAFSKVANHFFRMKHAKNCQPNSKEGRKYLRKAFSSLKQGDTVITTNWDTLAERVLMEEGKWFPSDGYGFPIRLEIDSKPLLKESSFLSVKVLKLHGSVGWIKGEKGTYLKSASYLQFMPFSKDGEKIRDTNAPSSESEGDPILIFPSYLKQLENPILQLIWEQAATALNQAKEVTFVGYSLPSADVAVRTLINPLRQRLVKKAVKVKVVDPDPTVRERWKEFLGEGVRYIEREAKDYFLSPES